MSPTLQALYYLGQQVLWFSVGIKKAGLWAAFLYI